MSGFASKRLALLLLTSAIARAQTATGSIQGTVRDPANAVVPGAKIELTNAGTREKRAVVTTSSVSTQLVFSNPAPYTFGNTPRLLSVLSGPGISTVDFSIFKNVPLTERAKLQFSSRSFQRLQSPGVWLARHEHRLFDRRSDLQPGEFAARCSARAEAHLLNGRD